MANATTEEAPLWLRRAMLGVCFWVGHRRALYRRHPLTEGAIVAELCNLINANLPSKLNLLCEVPYSKLIDVKDKESRFTERSRVDLSVGTIIRDQDGKTSMRDCKMIMEVKRTPSENAAIQNDLYRLAEVKNKKPSIQTILLLVSEGNRPQEYVSEDGYQINDTFEIEDEDACNYVVLSIQKAVFKLSDVDVAHYACALEVRSKEAKVRSQK